MHSGEGPIRVLVAEDEALIRLDLVEMLEELDYEVVGQAGDGAEALAAARSSAPDIVLLDVAMPGMDGISAAESISAEGLAPVLLLTAFSNPDTVRRASAAGVMGYLVKPFTKSDLPPAIEVAIARWLQARDQGAELAGLRRRLEDRQVVERAKGLLQQREGLTESAAYAAIRRLAMDARISLGDAGREILQGGDDPVL